ncbi:MAG: TIGR03118 family protein, partial [Candidatus Binataceae bacterium]
MNYKRFFSKRFLKMMAAAGVIALAPLSRADAQGYLQTNLVSDGSVTAKTVDPDLLNPWGVAFFPGGPFWISDNGKGVSTLYDGIGDNVSKAADLTVTIPPLGDTSAGAPGPSGMVWNGNPMAFPVGNNPGNTAAALFIWATEDGTIAAWQAGLSPESEAVIVVSNTNLTAGPVYKGLAIGNNSRGLFLYATDFRSGKIAVWNSTFGADAALNVKFIDHSIPSTFAPFGIQNINGQLWVTYAKQDTPKHDPVPGAGRGFVDVFDTDGNLIRRFAQRGVLNAPWGMVLAPDHFGEFTNDILIGNFGDGKITAWNPKTADFIDVMRNDKGKAIE